MADSRAYSGRQHPPTCSCVQCAEGRPAAKLTKAQAARLERKRVLREMENRHSLNCSCSQCEVVYSAAQESGYRSPRMEERRRRKAEQHRWESKLRSEPRAPSRSRLKAGLAVLLTGLIIFGAWGAWTLFFAGDNDSDSVRIAFVSDRNGNREIYTMLPDGSAVRRLTNNEFRDSSPAWSPDGSRIAFVRGTKIYTMSSDGSDVIQLTDSQSLAGDFDSSPSWSPDGSRIAFHSQRNYEVEIYTISSDGTDERQLTNSQKYRNYSPSWSPDGARIAFSANGRRIYTMSSSDGSDWRQLTDSEFRDLGPSWSPDGARIAFVRSGGGIYTMSSDGSDVKKLIAFGGSPSWAPDGSRIAFVSDRDGDREIYTMLPDGSDVMQLTNNDHEEFNPSWSPLPPPPESS